MFLLACSQSPSLLSVKAQSSHFSLDWTFIMRKKMQFYYKYVYNYHYFDVMACERE